MQLKSSLCLKLVWGTRSSSAENVRQAVETAGFASEWCAQDRALFGWCLTLLKEIGGGTALLHDLLVRPKLYPTSSCSVWIICVMESNIDKDLGFLCAEKVMHQPLMFNEMVP